ncbi:hypothetical protein ACROYT_G015569 [Oculina patagonica]
MIYEFTDECSPQYKSRHFAGDLSCCLADFGYLIKCNYFKTTHAKGEQDAAGAHIKQKVTQAVIRQTATIRNAKEMHEYLSQSFNAPAASTFSSRAKSVDLMRWFSSLFPPKEKMQWQETDQEKSFRNAKDSTTVITVVDEGNTSEDSEQDNVVHGFNLKVTKKDFQTLDPKTWLNDQEIRQYILEK